MKNMLICLLTLAVTYAWSAEPDQYIIQRENGRIIMAYKSFDDFLNSDKSWDSYCRLLYDVYPEIRVAHEKQVRWGGIDSVKFKDDVTTFKRADYESRLDQYDEKALNDLYDAVIGRAQDVLPTVTDTPVDLVLFLPYGGCFIEPGKERSTIYISLWISPDDVYKIMAHEYGHFLHFQRKPEEPLTLMREVVSEGMAVYLTTKILPELDLEHSIPFMPPESVQWCRDHEQVIADSIRLELNNSDDSIFRRYIGDGGYAQPPMGFVQKTAYFTGYRVIEACINSGMTVEEICALDSKAVLDKSGYFE